MEITISNSITSIGYYAFRECASLTEIVIPNSVTSIGARAFYDCRSLTEIVIPDSVTSIGEGAFIYCDSLKSIEIPDSVTSIGEYAFADYSGSLQYTIKGNGKYLGNENNPYLYLARATSQSISDITIESGCRFIGPWAFGSCYNLTSIVIPNSVTSIGGEAFSGCSSLTNVTFESTVGWKLSDGTDIDVTNPTKNATYLEDTYAFYVWERK